MRDIREDQCRRKIEGNSTPGVWPPSHAGLDAADIWWQRRVRTEAVPTGVERHYGRTGGGVHGRAEGGNPPCGAMGYKADGDEGPKK